MKSFVKAHVGRSAISRKEHAGSRETLAEAPEGWRVVGKGVLFTQVLREAALWSQEEPVEVVRAGTTKALGLVC